MTTSHRRFGLSCALSTQFDDRDAIDHAEMIAHARACLAEGCAPLVAVKSSEAAALIGTFSALRRARMG